jgi:hypothetical protein
MQEKNALSATTVAVKEPVKVPLVITQDSGGQRAGVMEYSPLTTFISTT